MKLLYGLSLCTALSCLSACGDTDSLGRARSEVSGVGGTAGSAAGGAAGSAGTLGAGGGGPSSDPAGLPDEVTLTMGPFEVETGSEVFICQTFANPFGGSAVHVREFEIHMTPGSHHLTVNYAQGNPATSEVAPCSGIDAPSGPFTTQRSHDVFAYHEGVAAELRGDQGLKLISHFVNPTLAPLTGEVQVTLRRAAPETVRQQAWMGTMSFVQIDVPPQQPRTVEDGTTVGGEGWNLLWILPHMHGRGTNFRVTGGPGGANAIYETDQWDAPSHKLDPPYRLNPGDSLNYSCTFFNDTATPLTFGQSPATNEMCLLVYHYTMGDMP